MMITPIPMEYAGVQFRSTLEADWAATLDSLGIEWQYEPIGIQLPSGALYRPDFYLPGIATWLEVKGPDGEGLDKTRELAEAVRCCPVSCGEECNHRWNPYQCVAVGLAPTRGAITSYLIGIYGQDEYEALVQCGSCSAWWWCDPSGAYGCRVHRRGGCGDHDLHGGEQLPAFVQVKRLVS